MKPENKYIYSEQALAVYEVVEKMEKELTSMLFDIKNSKNWALKLKYPFVWLVSKLATKFKNYITNNPRKYSKGVYNSFSNSRKRMLDKYVKKANEELKKLK